MTHLEEKEQRCRMEDVDLHGKVWCSSLKDNGNLEVKGTLQTFCFNFRTSRRQGTGSEVPQDH